MIKEIGYALLIAVFNASAGFLTTRLCLNKSWKAFTRAVFGSMAARYILTAAILWIVLSRESVNKLIFSLAFMIATFFAIMFEALLLHKAAIKDKNKKQ